MTKTFILTIDYEIFFGFTSGSVKACMIKPTKDLASILEVSHSTMTVFWDVLHFKKMLENSTNQRSNTDDAILIRDQIQSLAMAGHDIQLHVHPHWLNSYYLEDRWEFDYQKFRLHDLSSEMNPNDISTILGCLEISKNLIESVVGDVCPNHKVNTFRAGGYLIEPFEKLSTAFKKIGITFDSSTVPGLSSNISKVNSYNFLNYPRNLIYRFENTPGIINNTGNFIELPIATLEISVLMNLYFKALRRLKYKNLEAKRPGIGVSSTFIQKRNLVKKILTLFNSSIVQFTTDSNYKEKVEYMVKQVPDYSVMILHPKLLNNHTLEVLNNLLSENRIRFISIAEFTRNKELQV